MGSVLEMSDHVTDCRSTDDGVIPAIPAGLVKLGRSLSFSKLRGF